MSVNTLLLCLLYLVNLCHGSWSCGAASIDAQSVCLCGNETITIDDEYDCCGPGTLPLIPQILNPLDFESPDFESPDFESPDFESPDFESQDFESP